MELFPTSIEEKLGFDVIRRRINGSLRSRMGEDAWGAERPSSDLESVRHALRQAGELAEAIRFDDAVPLEHVLDVRDVLRRAVPEDAFVAPEDLLAVRLVMATCRRLCNYFKNRRAKYPTVAEMTDGLVQLGAFERHIESVIDDEGRIRDDATPELRRLRRLLLQKENRLREVLNAELRRAIGQGWATEDQPTIRGGRMVIPLRAEAKRKMQGFVHDTSATGQTVYLEPAAVLDLNNEVREIESEERREIERILREATAMLRADRPAVSSNLQILADFEVLYAKARFALDARASVPQIVAEPVIRVVRGRNPVLLLKFRRDKRDGTDESREVVPLDLSLGEGFRTLIITGPNAGGKSVAMKTVGLFVLMLAYGIPVPADAASTFGVFDRIMVDVGDEQSIEEDLSTFSSHLANIRQMLDRADERSLILIDEAGTGTDPAEGGALAQAILERLTKSGALTIATTHHGTLKAYAHETDGVENGSMQFDQETLSPTYRFLPGVPGSSYAFDIAARLGFPSDIIHEARALTGEQKTALEDLISEFTDRSTRLAEEIAENERLRTELTRERDQFRDRAERLKAEKDEIKARALAEAERIVGEANARIERTIREIKEAQAEKEQTRAVREQLEDFRESISKKKKKVAPRRRPAQRPSSAANDRTEVRPGDQVVLDQGTSVGEVLSVKRDEADVAFGTVRTRVKLSRLSKVGGRKPQQVTVKHASFDAGGGAVLRASTSLDVRGKRVEEALQEVERFLDDAVAARAGRVEILHGKGTGALRLAIKEALAKNPDVGHFEEAPWNQGGAGVTVVSLKG